MVRKSKLMSQYLKGAEIDVVINYKLIKDPDEHETLEKEIRELIEYCYREDQVHLLRNVPTGLC